MVWDSEGYWPVGERLFGLPGKEIFMKSATETRRQTMNRKKVREIVGGEVYEYRPIGKYIVSAPEVCRGRPTFKYTRIEVEGVLQQLGTGYSLERLLENYQGRISPAAIQEAMTLAGKALRKQIASSARVR